MEFFGQKVPKERFFRHPVYIQGVPKYALEEFFDHKMTKRTEKGSQHVFSFSFLTGVIELNFSLKLLLLLPEIDTKIMQIAMSIRMV